MSTPDFEAIRKRAEAVIEQAGDDSGPVDAEPYSSEALQEAEDVITLLDYIDARDSQKVASPTPPGVDQGVSLIEEQ